MAERKEELKAALSEMRTYSERFQQEIVASNGKINTLMADGYTAEAEVARQKCEAALSAISSEMLKNSDLWQQMTGQLSDLSLKEIDQTYGKARQLLDFIDGREGAEPPAGMDAQQTGSTRYFYE